MKLYKFVKFLDKFVPLRNAYTKNGAAERIPREPPWKSYEKK